MSRRIAACRSCREDIYWFENPATGKKIPIDAESLSDEDIEDEDIELDLSYMVSHFATCPQANDWRKPRKL